MADLTIGTVKIGSTAAKVEIATAGATIAAGDCLYFDATTAKYKIADCTSAATDAVVAIALDAGVDDGPLTIMRPGETINLGATLTVGEIYVLSTAGGIAPVADLASADYVTIVGFGESASLLKFRPVVTGYLKP